MIVIGKTSVMKLKQKNNFFANFFEFILKMARRNIILAGYSFDLIFVGFKLIKLLTFKNVWKWDRIFVRKIHTKKLNFMTRRKTSRQ